MLSKESIKFLQWFLNNDDWMYESQIQQGYSAFEYRTFSALKDDGYIDQCEDENEVPEYDGYSGVSFPQQYRISDKGRALLQCRRAKIIIEIRAWITLAIALAAFIKSFFF